MNSTIYRQAKVLVRGRLAGILSETGEGYRFQYDAEYLKDDPEPVSLLLPIREEPYDSVTLFPFFDGLIPEGWSLEMVSKKWGVPVKDRFGIMLKACHDPIGKVQIFEIEQGEGGDE